MLLQIRKIYPGAEFFHPGFGFATKNWSIFNPKNCHFLGNMIRDVYPGSGFIPDSDFFLFRIYPGFGFFSILNPFSGFRNPGGQKHWIPDPDPQYCRKVHHSAQLSQRSESCTAVLKILIMIRARLFIHLAGPNDTVTRSGCWHKTRIRMIQNVMDPDLA